MAVSPELALTEGTVEVWLMDAQPVAVSPR